MFLTNFRRQKLLLQKENTVTLVICGGLVDITLLEGDELQDRLS